MPPGIDIVFTRLGLEPVLHFGPRTGGAQITQPGLQPVTLGHALAAGKNLYPLAGLQRIRERYDGAVHFGTATTVADFGVYVIGEIQRRCAVGEIHHIPIGGKHVDPVLREVRAELLDDIPTVANHIIQIQHLTQPGNLFLVAARQVRRHVRLLVTPVGTHAQLGFLVHLCGANLYLEYLAFGPDHRSVQ